MGAAGGLSAPEVSGTPTAGQPVTVLVAGASSSMSTSGVLLYYLPGTGQVVVGHLRQVSVSTSSGTAVATLQGDGPLSSDYVGQVLTVAVILGDVFSPSAAPTGTSPSPATMAEAATVTFEVSASNATSPVSSGIPTAVWIVGGVVVGLLAVAAVGLAMRRQGPAAE